MTEQMVREAVGVFHDARSMQAAVDELLLNGFDRSFISMMATGETVERELSERYRRAEDIADDPTAPHVAYVGVDSPVTGQGAAAAGLAYIGACAAAAGVVASGGALALAIATAAVAGVSGGAIGAGLARYIAGQHARRLQEQLGRGGILLWVRTIDEGCEQLACEILERNGATSVHVHDLPAPELGAETGGVSNELALVNKPLAEWFQRRSRRIGPPVLVATMTEEIEIEIAIKRPLAGTGTPVR
jgi:hypothetical protein